MNIMDISLLLVVACLFSVSFGVNIVDDDAIPSAKWAPTKCGAANQITEWGKQVDPNKVLPEYPRPQLTRPDSSWKNLNGIWQFQSGNANDAPPFGKTLSSTILVPFPAESCLSGVGQTYKYLWYRLVFDKPAAFKNEKTLVHFGAVDWQTQVWLNTQPIGTHTGGYDRFTFDVSQLRDTNNELLVKVYDPSDAGYQPNGKQRISAINNPGGDTYTPASGIWGTVWLENVPSVYISHLRILADTQTLTITAFVKPGSTGPEQGVDRSGGDMPNMPITLSNANYYTQCFERCRSTSGCVGFSYGLPFCNSSASTAQCWLKSTITATSLDDCRISGELTKNVPVTFQVLDGSNVVATGTAQSSFPASIKIPSPKLWSPQSPFLYTLKISIDGDQVGSYFGMRTVSLGSYPHPQVNATGPQTGIDRGGSDMQGSPFTLSSADPKLCQSRCETTSGCKAWAYAVPNCDGFAQPTCWLKDSHPGTSSQKCRVSGDMGSPAFTGRRPLINNQYTFLAGWLDQSFWPDGIYTAPTDEALAFDLKAVKQFGLNTVRLHQKVNSERWYWYADSLGIVLLQDMFQKYGGASHATIQPFVVDYFRMIGNEYNHPSIIQWTVFNEGDCVGVFNVPQMVQIAKDLDPSRLYDTNSGGPANDLHIADVNDIHTYPYPGDPVPSATQYAMVGEYGGVGAFVAGKEWVAGKCTTYLHVNTPQDEANTYIQMTQTIKSHKLDIACVIYTQITDVELECDGFYNYDRTNKFNSAQMAAVVKANQDLITG